MSGKVVADMAAAPVWLQSENGILGMGLYPEAGAEDAQLISAGKQTVTVRAGGSLFDSARSFAMIRGGHVDLALLGALQVSAGGDLANWSMPGGRTMGIGGAMDLAAGAKRVVVLTRHTARDGASKLRTDCSYPQTAVGVVDREEHRPGHLRAERRRLLGHPARPWGVAVGGRSSDRCAAARSPDNRRLGTVIPPLPIERRAAHT